jgi:superfamily I DNA and/or RNA helicase
MSNFEIKDQNDLFNKISEWNITVKKYPDGFPKDCVKPLKKSYKSMDEYRKIMEPLFYLECWESFRKFCVSIREKKLSIEDNAVEVNILEFDVEELQDVKNFNNEELSMGNFEILIPNYFIYGYQGLHFKEKNKKDALDSMERRSSGNIVTNDLLYLARVSSDFNKIYYNTVVMVNISRDEEKDLISIPSRNDLYSCVPVFCTKKMTKSEIDEFKKELKTKRSDKSFWICIHAATFGSARKEFKTLEILSKNENLKICKEIITGKCRNTIHKEHDDSQEIREILKNEIKLNDYWSSVIVKIHQNSNLDKQERSDLTKLLLPNDKIDKNKTSVEIDKNLFELIKHLQQDILLPFTLEEQKLLYYKTFEGQGQTFYLNTKIGNLLLKNGHHVRLNKTINEIIRQYGLNITQASILARIKQEEDFLSLIQGPPGTGKTKMITAFIYQELREAKLKNSSNSGNKQNELKKNKILVCAPSNTACNEIARRLKRENVNTIIKTIRFAPDEQVDNSISHITLNKMAARKLYYRITEVKNIFDLAPSFKIPEATIEKLKNHHENIQSKMYELTKKRKILTHMMRMENSIKKVMDNVYEDICLLENDVDNYIQIFIDNLLLVDEPEFREYKDYMINTANECKKASFNEADVIVTTLVSSNNFYINNIKNKFSLLVVDEASQATELISLIPFCYNIPKAILIGDSKQLPPTVINNEIRTQNYDCSFFQRLEFNSPNSVHLLNIQYRMHPMISKLSSQCFYSNGIINGENVTSKKWEKDWYQNNSDFGPVMFYDVKGFSNNNNGSLNNSKEANHILDFITDFIQNPESIGYNSKISIISPYRAQVNLIKYKLKNYYRSILKKFDNVLDLEEFKKLNLSEKKTNLKLDLKDKVNGKKNKNILKRFNILDNINVNTVDSYQGQESDIVILSCVRSNTRSLGFLRDKRRLNVSITRARFSLIIFGDSETLCKDKEWKKIIKEIKSMNRFKSIN